jgi:hypothetical protein
MCGVAERTVSVTESLSGNQQAFGQDISNSESLDEFYRAFSKLVRSSREMELFLDTVFGTSSIAIGQDPDRMADSLYQTFVPKGTTGRAVIESNFLRNARVPTFTPARVQELKEKVSLREIQEKSDLLVIDLKEAASKVVEAQPAIKSEPPAAVEKKKAKRKKNKKKSANGAPKTEKMEKNVILESPSETDPETELSSSVEPVVSASDSSLSLDSSSSVSLDVEPIHLTPSVPSAKEDALEDYSADYQKWLEEQRTLSEAKKLKLESMRKKTAGATVLESAREPKSKQVIVVKGTNAHVYLAAMGRAEKATIKLPHVESFVGFLGGHIEQTEGSIYHVFLPAYSYDKSGKIMVDTKNLTRSNLHMHRGGDVSLSDLKAFLGEIGFKKAGLLEIEFEINL